MKCLTLLLLRTSSRCQRLSATLMFPGSCSTSVPEPWLIFKVGVPSISSGWRKKERKKKCGRRRVWDLLYDHFKVSCHLHLKRMATNCMRHSCIKNATKQAKLYIFAQWRLFSKSRLGCVFFPFITVNKHHTKVIAFYFLTYSNGKLKVNELVKIAGVLCTLCK